MFKWCLPMVVLACLGLLLVACVGQEAELSITDPSEHTFLDSSLPIAVSGTGSGLPESEIIVQALDQDGNLLGEASTTFAGEGTWSAELALEPIVADAGQITAIAPSSSGGDPLASTSIEVAFGRMQLLEGKTWYLEETIEGTEITALFEEGTVSGSAGCNTYQGAYESTPAAINSVISISNLATTQMMCEEQVMTQETVYLTALQEAQTYTMQAKGQQLVINTTGGALVFRAEANP